MAMKLEPASRTINVNGVQIYVEKAENTPPDGMRRLPVVFIHGLHSSREHWVNQVAAFSGKRPVITWDLRGHGLSDMEAPSITIEDHVNDLSALFDALDIREAHVVGGSAGGFVAQRIAVRRSDVVRSVTLVGTAASVPPETLDPEALSREVLSQGMGMYRDFMKKYTFGPNVSDEVFEFVFDILSHPSVEAAVRRLRGMLHYDGIENAKAIACPTLVLAGESDGTFDPKMSHELRRLVPDSQLAILPACGHLPQLEAPAVFNAVLDRFLDNVEKRGKTGQ